MKTHLTLPALLFLAAGLCAAEPKKPTNHLAKESSPYLLLHATNPVDWYPWGPEAFAKAKKEGKLVFLSIGYSACHWCHVMEKECFSQDDVAKILNEHFVCIKVDREERPDIDSIYMTSLYVLQGSGGWPLSMFLTADGKPILGGTYWPKEDRVVEGEKVRGFKSILNFVHELHRDKNKELEEQADKIAARTQQVLSGTVRGLALVEVNRDLIGEVHDAIREEFDKVHGGFGSPAKNFAGQKFPVAPYLRFLQYEASRPKADESIQKMLALTLDKMAQGGIYDQLGGGFHRYSVERTWTVPHFEKMLYDNAQLAEVYTLAWQATKKPLYKRVAQDTLAFVSRELTTPEGGFYSALDADSDGEEGRFYVWKTKEIDDAIGNKDDAAFFKKVYDADDASNFEGKYHILVLKKSLADRAKNLKMSEEELDAKLAPVRQKLFEARAKRVRPAADTKVLTAWNGEMIGAFALAGEVFKEPKYTAVAEKAAKFILEKLRTKDGRLLRTYGAAPGGKPEAKLNGYLDDYTDMVHGLLNLYSATKDKKWLDEAKALTATMIKYHADKETGGFFYTSSDHEKLFARGKDQSDNAQPSGNSMAGKNLVRLWLLTGDDEYKKLAEQQLKVFATPMHSNPSIMTTMAEAMAMFIDGPKK